MKQAKDTVCYAYFFTIRMRLVYVAVSPAIFDLPVCFKHGQIRGSHPTVPNVYVVRSITLSYSRYTHEAHKKDENMIRVITIPTFTSCAVYSNNLQMFTLCRGSAAASSFFYVCMLIRLFCYFDIPYSVVLVQSSGAQPIRSVLHLLPCCFHCHSPRDLVSHLGQAMRSTEVRTKKMEMPP